MLMVCGVARGQLPCDTLRTGAVDLTESPTTSSLGSNLSVVLKGGRAFFAASQPGEGWSIWRTDGTAAGTVKVVSAPSGAFSSLGLLGASDDAMYFVGNAGSGPALWCSDGGDSPPVLLESSYVAVRDTLNQPIFAAVGSMAIYGSGGQLVGVQSAGGVVVREVLHVIESDRVTPPARIGGRLVYGIEAGDVDGSSLWITDGALTGTTLLRSYSGANSAFARTRDLVSIGNRVVFVAGDADFGEEVWSTDGSIAGTRRETDFNIGPQSSAISMAGGGDGRAWFNVSTDHYHDGAWVSETASGLIPVNVNSGLSTNPTPVLDLGDGRVVFAASRDGFNFTGLEPYVSDGTPEGTVQLADIVPGSGNSMYVVGQRGAVIGGGDTGLPVRAVFCADINGHLTAGGEEIWVTDGTPAGTSKLADRTVGSTSWFVVSDGRRAYFPQLGGELWVTDGTSANTRRLRSATGQPGFTSASQPVILPAGALFAATDTASGREPWMTTGDDEGTRPLVDIAGGSVSSSISAMQPFNGEVVVMLSGSTLAWDGLGSARALAATGTGSTAWRPSIVSGARLIVDTGAQLRALDLAAPAPIVPVTLPAQPLSATFPSSNLAKLGETLVVFRGVPAITPSVGGELMITDGTPAGTRLVRDIAVGTQGSNPFDFQRVDGRVVFFAATPSTGAEPWTTDGTEAGTLPLGDVAPGTRGSWQSNPDQSRVMGAAFGGEIYWILSGGNSVNGLYATDGLTLRQVDLGGLVPQGPIAATSAGVFFVNSTATTRQVHVTNGQPGGTRLALTLTSASTQVVEMWPWAEGDPRLLVEAGSPRTLWVTDGDAATAVNLIRTSYRGNSVLDVIPGAAGAGGLLVGVRTSVETHLLRLSGAVFSPDACLVSTWTYPFQIDQRVSMAMYRVNSHLYLIGADPIIGTEPRVIDLCPADFDNSGAIGVQDLFDFLAAWFANHPDADVDGPAGVSLEDLFAFLRGWFAGCS